MRFIATTIVLYIIVFFLSSCTDTARILNDVNNDVIFSSVIFCSIEDDAIIKNLRPGITIRFSDDMKKSSVNNNIALKTWHGISVAIDREWKSDHEICITPAADLIHHVRYSLTIENKALNYSGTELKEKFVLTFKTAYDPYPPQIIETIPEDSTNNFRSSESIVIIFNEEMSTDTVEDIFRLTLLHDEDTTIDTDVNWSDDNRICYFKPSTNLIPFEKYQFTLNNTIEDLYQNRLETALTLIFTVAGKYIYKNTINAPSGFSGFQPEVIAFDKRPSFYDIYVADNSNDTIVKFEDNGAYVRHWDVSADCGGIAVQTALDEESSTIYVTEKDNHRIRKYDTEGGYCGWIGKGVDTFDVSTNGWHRHDSILIPQSGDGNGDFNNPAGIIVGPDENLYVVDSGNNRIQIIGNDGTFIDTWGHDGTGDGEFNNPTGIAIDSSNNIYVADTGNNRIQRFDSAARQWVAFGSDDAPFNGPTGITVDDNDYIYITEPENHRVLKFDQNGNLLTAWGDNTGDQDHYLTSPGGIGVHISGDVFICDGESGKISIFEIDEL